MQKTDSQPDTTDFWQSGHTFIFPNEVETPSNNDGIVENMEKGSSKIFGMQDHDAKLQYLVGCGTVPTFSYNLEM